MSGMKWFPFPMVMRAALRLRSLNKWRVLGRNESERCLKTTKSSRKYTALIGERMARGVLGMHLRGLVEEAREQFPLHNHPGALGGRRGKEPARNLHARQR